MVHMGAHGTLEWLPGKSVAAVVLMLAECAARPDAGDLSVHRQRSRRSRCRQAPDRRRDYRPHDAASQRWTSAAGTVSDRTPARRILHRRGLDPRRRERLARSIIDAARDAGLDRDSGLTEVMDTPREAVVRLDSFVCDVKATMVADGLHVFGRSPLQPDEHEGTIPYEACAAGERSALLAALNGKHVPPGPAGSPWRARRDVLPTGRNLFTVDCRAVPSRTATEQGKRLADALLTRHLQDHGDYPRNVMLDLWGLGDDAHRGRGICHGAAIDGRDTRCGTPRRTGLTGFEVIALPTLGRPRIDVTLRISGLFRDVFPTLPVLFEQARCRTRRT